MPECRVVPAAWVVWVVWVACDRQTEGTGGFRASHPVTADGCANLICAFRKPTVAPRPTLGSANKARRGRIPAVFDQ